MMTTKIYSMIMHDGSRHFAALPETITWEALRDHIALLSSAEVTGFITDHITEAWIDFTFKGHKFSANNQYGDYWFFVEDVECPDDILTEVMVHCEKATGSDAV